MGESFSFERAKIPQRGWQPQKLERLVPRKKIIKPLLPTRENYQIPDERKGKGEGLKVEQALVEAMKRIPGVADAHLSSPVQDVQGVDVELKFRGDYLEPVRLQITTNPALVPEKIQRVKKDATVLLVKRDDFDERGDLKPRAKQKVMSKIIKRMPKDYRQGLMDYYAID